MNTDETRIRLSGDLVPTDYPSPPGDPACFDCGGFGPCDVCDNPLSSASAIAFDLHRNGLLRQACCTYAAKIIRRHLVANMQLVEAGDAAIEAVDK